MTTNQKGAIAETAIIHEVVKRGVGVWKPVVEGARYDLILEVGSRLLRVQCKSAAKRGEVIAVPCYSSRRCRDGYLKRSYTPAEIDAIVAYCSDLDRCYLLPLDAFGQRTEISLRLGPTRNNQRRGVNWAADFDLESLDWTRYFEGP